MKIAKEILSTKDSYYSTNVYKTGERAYRESDVLQAMQSYADQFKPKWISVDERLPDENGYYLCWIGYECGLVHYHKDSGWQNGFYHPTHWQPLPPQPETDKQKNI